MKNKKLIIIAGPTATGKTGLSISLAEKYKLPIVNADSLLFYHELNIGVAKPSSEELKKVPHYLINISSIANPLNAKNYRELAIKTLNDLWDSNYPAIILSGGSGFYIKALLYGMYDSQTSQPDVTDRSNQLYNEKGIQPFIDILSQCDPESLEKLHKNDHYRLRRAVEHWWATNTPFSSVGKIQNERNKVNPFWKNEGWEILFLYTDIAKDKHQHIIAMRTKSMIEEGLIEEVQKLLQVYKGSEKPLLSIGYKEVQDYLSGKIGSLEKLHEAIVISTRQLAKSQRTWFAPIEKISLTYPNFIKEAEQFVEKFISYSKT